MCMKEYLRNLFRIKALINKKNASILTLTLCLLVPMFCLFRNNASLATFEHGMQKRFSYSFAKFEQSCSIIGTNMDLSGLVSNLSCQPIRSNAEQYCVNINGVVYPQYIPSYQSQSIDFDCLNVLNATKRILIWNKFFGEECFGFGCSKKGIKERMNCPLNCEMFEDKSRINESDLIFVHMADPVGALPQQRGPNQRWVFNLLESPLTFARNFNSLNGLFNYTATYRLNSDFKSTYFNNNFVWKLNNSFNVNHDFAQSKSRMAAAVISNCADSARRLDYVSEMQQVMSVDVFGKCGKPCVVKFSDGRAGECKNVIAHEYLFYLAFENSVCKDYITEKFFDLIERPIVPVVRGGGPYEFFVRHFINVHSFKMINYQS